MAASWQFDHEKINETMRQNETPFFVCRFICVLTNPLMSDDFATGGDNLGFFSFVGSWTTSTSPARKVRIPIP